MARFFGNNELRRIYEASGVENTLFANKSTSAPMVNDLLFVAIVLVRGICEKIMTVTDSWAYDASESLPGWLLISNVVLPKKHNGGDIDQE